MDQTDFRNYAPRFFSEDEVAGIGRELVALADKVRAKFGGPLVITSGYREGDGGAHGKGLAIDARSGSSTNHFKLMRACMELGFKRVGVYVKPFDCPHCQKQISQVRFEYGHFHFDIDPDLPQGVLWMGISK